MNNSTVLSLKLDASTQDPTLKELAAFIQRARDLGIHEDTYVNVLRDSLTVVEGNTE